MQNDRYRYLADKWLKGTITPEEEAEYVQWYNADAEAPLTLAGSHETHEARMLQDLRSRMRTGSGKVMIWRAAASILILAGTAAAIWYSLPDKKTPQFASAQLFKNDIQPANQAVTLTLENGSTVLLDTMHNGKINNHTSKEDNSLVYTPGSNGEMQYHTVATGSGKTYQLRLPDGTMVWLDAKSSIRFPLRFAGTERTVKITGQVYLEVASSARQPFKVMAEQEMIQVLGTSFNVNTYEAATRTTLIEGSIKIRNTLLRPSEQAVCNASGEPEILKQADLEEVMAWKSGRFRFNGTPIQVIMDQLKRWYDIEVIYAEELPAMQLVAKIDRNLPISRILTLLEMTGQVAFEIEDNKVIVSKGKNTTK